MNICAIFERVAQQLPPGAVKLSDGQCWQVEIGGENVMVIAPQDAPSLIAVDVIGSYASVSDRGLLLEEALKANRFWDETRGATLSVNPETGELTLADRRELEWFAEDGAMMEFLVTFAEVARSWRQYLVSCTPSERVDEFNSSARESSETEMRFSP